MAISEKLLKAKHLTIESLEAMTTRAARSRKPNEQKLIVGKFAQSLYAQALALCKSIPLDQPVCVAVTRIVLHVALAQGFDSDTKLDTNTRAVLAEELHRLFKASTCFLKHGSRGYRYLAPETRDMIKNGAAKPAHPVKATARSLALPDSQA